MATKNNAFYCIGRTGGSDGYLDDIDGNGLLDGDMAVVMEDGETYLYRLNSSSGATEDGLLVVSPDSNPGSKRWILQNEVIQKHNVFRKNLIINGAMQVAQRGTSFATMGNGDSQFTLDRWKFWEVGTCVGEVTVTQDTDVPSGEGFANSLKVDCTTAENFTDTSTIIALQYKIEAQDLVHLKWGTSSAEDLVFSFWFKSDTKTGDLALWFYQPDSDQSYATRITIANNNWNKYTIVLPGDTSGDFDDNNGEGLRIRFNFSLGSTREGATEDVWESFTNYYETSIDNFLDSVSNNLWITGVQLEVGSQATSFDHRPYGEVLRQCLRYYERWDAGDLGANDNLEVASGYCYSTTVLYAPITYFPKRAKPTIVAESAPSHWNVGHEASATVCSNITFSNIHVRSVRVNASVASGLTVGNAGRFYSGTALGNYLEFDAEL
jgi:hypothetical protein